MNKEERWRLLALDAALVTAEGVSDPDVSEAISLLQDVLEEKCGDMGLPELGSFLAEQKKACKKLANSESLFGVVV